MKLLLFFIFLTSVAFAQTNSFCHLSSRMINLKNESIKNQHFEVVATVMTSHTGGKRLSSGSVNDANNRIFAALPCRNALGKRITVVCAETGREVKNVPILDVGPWSINDKYWENGTRPLAEKGISDKYGRAKNKAGIDLSLKLCEELGLSYPYKGTIEWYFEI